MRIPLFFGGHWAAYAKESEEDDRPIEFALIHGHCWMEHDHVIQLKVIKKEQHDEHLWHCKKCDVREKTKPCKKRCDELVTAS